MIVGGGIVPSMNFTRHEVHRPRAPQVAVMSTPAAWAALRIVVPDATSSVRSPGRIRNAIAMSPDCITRNLVMQRARLNLGEEMRPMLEVVGALAFVGVLVAAPLAWREWRDRMEAHR